MQDNSFLYEYAVIRVVPKVEREEFINVGVIVFSKKTGYLRMRYQINVGRLCAFATELDIDQLHTHLEAFDKICSGAKEGGPIAQLDAPERFRWLTAVKSSCLQSSRPHPGFSGNLDQTLLCLFEELVL